MTFNLTLVASDSPLTDEIIGKVRRCPATHIPPDRPLSTTWLSQGRAAEITISDPPDKTGMKHLRKLLAKDKTDIFITPVKDRRKSLLMADMDSTIVNGETLDELADWAGIKDKIAAITTRAMNGDLDFEAAVRERVSLLKGLPRTTIEKTLNQITLSAGARTLVATMSKHGAHCVLVSGGFTVFTAAVAAELQFHAHHGNELGINGDILTGAVHDPILDKHKKAALMDFYRTEHGLDETQTIAVGDGANDLPMLKAAALGIGYRPKQLLQKHLINQIHYGDLVSVLYAQGYTDDEIAFQDAA